MESEGGQMIYVRVKKLTDTAMMPTKGSAFAAGFDLYADTSEDIVVQPGKVVPFYTGLSMELPNGYFGAVYPRAGLATEYGLRLPNCVGVIDPDYRGNVGVPLRNDSDQPVTVLAHERVAQIVFQRCEAVGLYEADELSQTDRGAVGFGSSGRQ
jgi:dUTP pyrophosphatase